MEQKMTIGDIFKKHGLVINHVKIEHYGFTKKTPLEEIDRVLNLVMLQGDMNQEDMQRTKIGLK
jgi:hypothetical protein